MYSSIHLVDSSSTSSGTSEPSSLNRSVESILDSKEGKMFIGGLNKKTIVDGLRNYFSKFGPIKECTIMLDAKTKLSRGFAFVTFFDQESVQKVLGVKEHYLDGKKIDPQTAIRMISPARSVHNVHNKLFIGGVSQQTTAEDLKKYFSEKFGEVDDIALKVAFDKEYEPKKHRGFGFITFIDPEVAKRVCAVHYHQIHDKMVETKVAIKKEDMAKQASKQPSSDQDFYNRIGLHALFDFIYPWMQTDSIPQVPIGLNANSFSGNFEAPQVVPKADSWMSKVSSRSAFSQAPMIPNAQEAPLVLPLQSMSPDSMDKPKGYRQRIEAKYSLAYSTSY